MLKPPDSPRHPPLNALQRLSAASGQVARCASADPPCREFAARAEVAKWHRAEDFGSPTTSAATRSVPRASARCPPLTQFQLLSACASRGDLKANNVMFCPPNCDQPLRIGRRRPQCGRRTAAGRGMVMAMRSFPIWRAQQLDDLRMSIATRVVDR